MKKFKLLPFLLILLLAFSLLPSSALALSEPEIGASAAILVDADSGEVYYEKNAESALPPASTTKMMTALLAAEAVEAGEIGLTDMVTVSGDALYNLEEDSTDASPRLVAGEEISVENLVYCVMLASANEACNALAQYISGSISGFVDRMNERAAELGCTNTRFTNTNGLEEEGHYSSAADLAIIAREAMTHPFFAQVCGTYSYTVPATNETQARELENSNKLLEKGGEYYFESAYGIKTGYFTNAGYCLVSAAEKNDMDVICVVLGSQELGDQFLDSQTLYNWFFENYEYYQILSSAETVVTVPVEMGTANTVGVRAEDVVSVLLPKDYDDSHINYVYTLNHEAAGTTLEAPVNAGDVLGEITVVEEDESGNVVRTFGTSRLVAANSVEMSRMEYIRTQIGALFAAPVVRRIITILIVLLAIYVLLIVFYYVQRVRHVSSVREAKRERAARLTEEEARWLSIPEETDSDPGIGYFADTTAPEDDEAGEAAGDNVLSFADHKSPAAPKAEEPRRRVPRNELADDDFFDSFFKDE